MLILAHFCWSTSTIALFIYLFGESDRTNFSQTCYNVCSCEISICVYQRMKKLFELIRIFPSAMETWLMHGRWIIMVVLLACVSPYWGLNIFNNWWMWIFSWMQEKGNLDLAIRYYLVAIEVSLNFETQFLILFIPSSLIYFHFFFLLWKIP